MESTRRSFVAGTAAGMAGLAAVAAAGAAEADEAAGDAKVQRDVDILIIGAGIAGFAAGIAAIQAGVATDRVLIVDKVSGEGADFGGSSLVMSGNYLYPTDGSPEGVEAFAQAAIDITGGVQDADLLHTLAEHALDDLDWIIGLGCEFGDDVNLGGGAGIDAASTRAMAGDGTVANLRAAYESLGGEVAWNTRAVQLLTGATGVAGAKCTDGAGLFDIAAKQVIIATGGLLSSAYWKEQVFGQYGGFIMSRAPQCITGDGLGLGLSVGGVLAAHSIGAKALYAGISYPGVVRPMGGTVGGMAPYCLCVNADGQRYVDETQVATQANMRKLMDEPACTIGMLSDATQAENLASSIEKLDALNVPTYTFDTLDEVAELFGCDADALKATVEAFNAAIVDNRTEGLAVEKTANAAPVATPPFYAWYPFMLSSSFTGAGLQIDSDAHATFADGAAIPGLYAAGEVTGGFAYDEFFHGMNHTKAVVFGRIAGQRTAEAVL